MVEPTTNASTGPSSTPRGMRVFILICLGQAVTNFGSQLTSFALGVWVFQTTGSTTRFALITVLTLLPGILVAPLAGALVDRWDRRRVMIVNDTAYAVITGFLALLVWTGGLEIWHIYALVPLGSVFHAFQIPAFAASTPMLVPAKDLGRANGFVQLGTAGAMIFSPLAAGALLGMIGLLGIMAIDLLTAGFAVGTLAMVRIPRPPPQDVENSKGWRRLLDQVAAGWAVIRARPGLLALLGLSASLAFSIGTVEVLLTPLILSFASAKHLGVVLTSASVGYLVGSVVMSAWGGPARRIEGILAFLAVQGVILAIGVSRPSVPFVAWGAFSFMFFSPIVVGCGQAIWQSKVPPAFQGRVFSLREMVSHANQMLAILLVGVLADHVFEPLLAEGAFLAPSVGRVIGTGPGRGIAFLLICQGGILLVTIVLAWNYPRLRRLEAEIPDTYS